MASKITVTIKSDDNSITFIKDFEAVDSPDHLSSAIIKDCKDRAFKQFDELYPRVINTKQTLKISRL